MVRVEHKHANNSESADRHWSAYLVKTGNIYWTKENCRLLNLPLKIEDQVALNKSLLKIAGVCVCVCARARACLCLCMCMFACLCVCVCTRAWACIRVCLRFCTYLWVRACVRPWVSEKGEEVKEGKGDWKWKDNFNSRNLTFSIIYKPTDAQS